MKCAIRCLVACSVALVVLSAGLTAADQNKSVLDYYRLLKPDMLGGTRFDFTKKGNSWQTRSPITDEEIVCVVDLKNGYIEVSDPGTGGGTLTQEVALFINRKGESFIGVNVTTFDGIGIGNECKFYRWTGKGWAPASVMPEIPLSQFFKQGFDPSTVDGKLSLSYDLPRTGTTVSVSLDTTRLQRIASGFMEPGEDEIRNAKKALANIAYRSVELLWNMDAGVFTPGKKLK